MSTSSRILGFPRNGSVSDVGPRGKPPVPIGMGVTAELVNVTPSIAQMWLDSGNHGNRRVRAAQVRRIAAKIAQGRFTFNHQGIAFDGAGNLLDGQHRLMAIVAARQPVYMLVFRGLPTASVIGMDENVTRDVKDVFGTLVVGGDVDHHVVATARAMYGSNDVSAGSDKDKEFWIGYIVQHREAIDFAVKVMTGCAKNSILRGVVARAWYTPENRDRLEVFGAVCATGVMTQAGDQAAVTLRDHHIKYRRMNTGRVMRVVFYRKVESALAAFLEGRRLSKLYEASSELFPIPGEDD